MTGARILSGISGRLSTGARHVVNHAAYVQPVVSLATEVSWTLHAVMQYKSLRLSAMSTLLDHEQVELFPKRTFRCDCPTSSTSVACTLHRVLEEPNADNSYGQNFKGMFCRCGRPYDPTTETETMLQCVICEVRNFVLRRSEIELHQHSRVSRIGTTNHV